MTGMRSQRSYLYDAVKRVDLKMFVERESGASLEKKGNDNWMGICPLHRDSQASFSVTRDPSGKWFYNCFGCNSKGSIIDFCQTKFDLETPGEALILVAEKEGIKCDETLILKATREAKVESNRRMAVHVAHCTSASTCLRLLRMAPGNDTVAVWVAKAYARMNILLDDEETREADIAKVGNEALRMMDELWEKEKIE